MKKINIKSLIIGVFIGVLISSGVVYAVTLIDSKDVTYTPSDNEFNVSNVESALNELYDKMQIVRSHTESYFGVSHTPGVTFPVTMTIKTTSNSNTLIINGHLTGCSGLPTFTVFKVIDSKGNELERKHIYEGESTNQNGAISRSFIYVYQCEPNETYTISYTSVNSAHPYQGGNVMAIVINSKNITPIVKAYAESHFGVSHTPGVTFPVTMTIATPPNSNTLIINGHLTGSSGLPVFTVFKVIDSKGNELERRHVYEGGITNQNGGISRSYIYVYRCKPNETYTISYTSVNSAHSYQGGNVMATVY